VTGEANVDVSLTPLVVGMVAAFLSGALAIAGLLRFLRSSSLAVFVWYRVGLAGAILVAWLAR
jgi:undecaprenyl-diphosphatase